MGDITSIQIDSVTHDIEAKVFSSAPLDDEMYVIRNKALVVYTPPASASIPVGSSITLYSEEPVVTIAGMTFTSTLDQYYYTRTS